MKKYLRLKNGRYITASDFVPKSKKTYSFEEFEKCAREHIECYFIDEINKTLYSQGYSEEWDTFPDYDEETWTKEYDNIEDLLDGYVVRNELVRDLDVAKSYSKTFGQPVYGARWTSYGLIYIAKLTDEGWKLI